MPLKFTTRITNSHRVTVGLQVEPWGEYYRIAPGAHVDLRVEGPDGDESAEGASLLDFEYGRELITVYAQRGSQLEVVGAEMAPWPSTDGEG